MEKGLNEWRRIETLQVQLLGYSHSTTPVLNGEGGGDNGTGCDLCATARPTQKDGSGGEDTQGGIEGGGS